MNAMTILIDGVRAALGVPAAAYALAAIGVNLQFGYTGLLNFGQVGFMLVGAYATAIAAQRGVPLPFAFVIGVLAAVGLGLLLGIPTLRLRGDFLAIVTISVAEILRLAARARQLEDLTGASRGVGDFGPAFYDWNPIPRGRYGLGDLRFDERQLWAVLIGWTMVVLTALLVRRLVRSPWGRVVKGIRADQDAPRALGKNVFAYKVQSLVIGGVIGSLAGMLLAVEAQFTHPDDWTSAVTFYAYVALILGGVATTFGPVMGAMAFWFFAQGFDSFLRQSIAAGWFGFLEPSDVGAIRFAMVGLVLILLMAFRPQGLLGDEREVEVIDR